MSLSWKARRYVLEGAARYCAPACGFHCTKAAHDLAVARAKRLAASLGRGWTYRVHENMGWHYNVVSPCGRIKVAANIDWRTRRPRDYTAFLGDRRDRGCSGRWAEHGKSSRAAIKNVVRVAKAELRTISARLEGL